MTYVVISLVLNVIFTLFVLQRQHKQYGIKLLEQKELISNIIDSNNQRLLAVTTKLDDSNQKNITLLQAKNSSLSDEVNLLSEKLEQVSKSLEGISEWFILPQSVSKNEKEKYNLKISEIYKQYTELGLRSFKDKYSSYRVIGLENSEQLQINKNIQPNFLEMATGKYLAIEIENNIFALFLQKDLNLYDGIFAGIGIPFIFEMDMEPLKGFTYSKWKLIKPAIFTLMSKKWVCLEKGQIELEPKKVENEIVDEKVEKEETEEQFVSEEDINEPLETKKSPEPKLGFVKNLLEKIGKKKLKDLNNKFFPEGRELNFDYFGANFNSENKSNKISKFEKKKLEICEDFNNFSLKFFKQKYPDIITLEIFVNENNQEFFKGSERGAFIAVKALENNYLIFFSKNKAISIYDNISLVFELDEKFNEVESTKNWKILEPAVFSSDGGKWELINKGVITIK